MKILSKISLLFFAYILLSYIFIGITTVPAEGDSLNYHIPVAKAYLDGTIFTPEKIQGVPFLKYSPGASEGILALFYFLNIPPNLFNILGVVVLFLSCFYLGKRFGLGHNFSIIFGTTFVTLNGIVRWLDTQKIDILLASFFAFSLGLLVKPEKSVRYFFLLGLSLGMLTGSKYSGLLFGVVLMVVFSRKIIPYLSFKRFFAFLLPFLFAGGFWYVRNFIATGNPMYPQGFLFFKDHGFDILNLQVWRVATGSWFGATGTFNAFISEYMVWVLAIPIVFLYVVKNIRRLGDPKVISFATLLLIGAVNFFIYLFLPSDNYEWIMVSVIRYSYPAFLPFLLGLFLLAKKYNWSEKVAVASIVNMFFIGFPTVYNPKLAFLLVPVGIWFFSREFKKGKGRK